MVAWIVIGACGCTNNNTEADRESCGVGASCATTGSTVATTIATTSTSIAPTTTVPESTAAAAPAGIVRPSVESDRCEPLAAREFADATRDLHLFAAPVTDPTPIQIIGDPIGGPTVPFALVQRYPRQAFAPGSETIAIHGWSVAVTVYDNGNGDARWNLTDGTEGYLRSRGLDRDAVIGIIASLTPRDPTAEIPGFDYVPDPSTTSKLELVAEHMSGGVRGGGT